MEDNLFGDQENQKLKLTSTPKGLFSTAFEICRDVDNEVVYFKDGTSSRLLTPYMSQVNFTKYAHSKFDDFATRPEANVHNSQELNNIIIEFFKEDEAYMKQLIKAVEEGRHMSLEQKAMVKKAANYIWGIQNDYTNGYEENSSSKIFKANETYRNTQTVDFIENYDEYMSQTALIVVKLHPKRKYIKNYKLSQKIYLGKKLNLAERFDEKFLITLKKTK